MSCPLNALARLFARSFAHGTLVDLEDNGKVVRIAGAHRDLGKEPILTVDSEPGAGSTFTVTLPRTMPAARTE